MSVCIMSGGASWLNKRDGLIYYLFFCYFCFLGSLWSCSLGKVYIYLLLRISRYSTPFKKYWSFLFCNADILYSSRDWDHSSLNWSMEYPVGSSLNTLLQVEYNGILGFSVAIPEVSLFFFFFLWALLRNMQTTLLSNEAKPSGCPIIWFQERVIGPGTIRMGKNMRSATHSKTSTSVIIEIKAARK